jgi:hypothetical protein
MQKKRDEKLTDLEKIYLPRLEGAKFHRRKK